MNEELKIIIKAVTDEAKKNLAGVKQELEHMQEEGEKAGSTVDKALKGFAKSAAIAVGAITAVVTAMVTLTHRSLEFQKAQAKVVASFQAVGSSAEQANATYTDLYKFLGDTDKATETAQSLALITQNEKELAEWTTILQGAYALMGDKLPTEGLAEAANETIKTGVVTGQLADALNWLGVSEDAMNATLAATNSQSEREQILRSTLNSLYGKSAAIYEHNNKSIMAYNESQAKLNTALAQATKYVLPLMTQLNNLAAILLQILAPAFKLVAAIVSVFVEWIVVAVNFIGSLFGLVESGGTQVGESINNAMNTVQDSISSASGSMGDLGGAIGDATEQAKELKKQTMGFDELNIVSSAPSSTSTGGIGSIGGGASVPSLEMPDLSSIGDGIKDFQDTVDNIKEKMEGIAVLVGIVAAGFAAWKISQLLDDLDAGWKTITEIKNKISSIAGTFMIMAGAVLLVWGYSDAWANGIDWGNFTLILSGIALIVGGLALTVGSTAAAFATVTGGIAMLVIGIKDLVENGYSMEAVIMVAVGAITVLIGVIWAMNAALLANPITWVVVAIMALVAAFVVLWNECEGFRNFWKAVWDGIVTAFNATVAWFKQACKDIGKFFSDLWKGIKSTFSAVGTWFTNVFSAAAKGIKSAFSTVGSFFSNLWKDIKKIFSNVGTAVGEAVSGAFKSAINWVLEKAISLINGFIKTINGAIGVINKIPGVDIKKIKLLDVPKLATGGIVSSATMAMIGERGKEAVLPLENNTGWMDTLADRIASRQNTPSKLVLMLDGKQLGYATIGSINDITRQTGKLQLNLI